MQKKVRYTMFSSDCHVDETIVSDTFFVEHSFGCRRIAVSNTPAIGLVEDGETTQIYSR